MDGKDNELEHLFIEELLSLHGEYVTDLLRDQIGKKKLTISENLLESISYKVSKNGLDPVLLINFLSYGRAIEIRWHKKSTNAMLLNKPNTNQIVWGIRENKKRVSKKDTRWYAKTAYGTINRLLAILASEYSEEEKNRLKQILQRRYESKN